MNKWQQWGEHKIGFREFLVFYAEGGHGKRRNEATTKKWAIRQPDFELAKTAHGETRVFASSAGATKAADKLIKTWDFNAEIPEEPTSKVSGKPKNLKPKNDREKLQFQISEKLAEQHNMDWEMALASSQNLVKGLTDSGVEMALLELALPSRN